MSDEGDRPKGFEPVAPGRLAQQEAETLLSTTGDSVPPPSIEVGAVLGGKYRLTRFLGQGGMGSAGRRRSARRPR
jgi:hypothetical protein